MIAAKCRLKGRQRYAALASTMDSDAGVRADKADAASDEDHAAPIVMSAKAVILPE